MKIKFNHEPAQERVARSVFEELDITKKFKGEFTFADEEELMRFLDHLENDFVISKKSEDKQKFYRTALPVIFRLSKKIRSSTGLQEKKLSQFLPLQ